MGFSAMAAGAVLGAASSYGNAKAKKGALRQQAQVDEWQAEQALNAGADQEQSSRLQTAQVFGKQRANMAANGVDLGEGSATDVLASTKLIGEHDALTIKDNASRTAWGYRTNAAVATAQADNIDPWASATGSLLGSAGSVSASWTQGKKNGSLPGWATTAASWMGS